VPEPFTDAVAAPPATGSPRYVVYGAGGIGAGVAGCLALAGRDVVAVARGAHLEALQAHGLELRRPAGVTMVPLAAVGYVGDAGLRAGDVVMLAVKSQHTAGALAELAALGEPDLSVVCVQNGVDNERQALRYFERVYGMCVMMPALHLEPGTVELRDGVPGVLDLGRYPAGVDEVAQTVAADLVAAGFGSEPHPAIMTRKYRKLLSNLGNSLDAAVGRTGRQTWLSAAAGQEAAACFAAAGIEVGSEAEDEARRAAMPEPPTPDPNPRPGGSSWQSLARRSTSIESDFLNGEIVLLGRLYGVPTPVNAWLSHLANGLVRRGAPPGSLSVDDVEARAAAAGLVPAGSTG
jgi:2-dehydropantoate 2-reductase